jgi:hypothetical protein
MCIMSPPVDGSDGDGPRATGLDGRTHMLYPADYGGICKKHHEVGDAACYDLATAQELPASQRASWCEEAREARGGSVSIWFSNCPMEICYIQGNRAISP